MALSWRYISLVVNQGYFNGSITLKTTCYSDGQLHFEEDKTARRYPKSEVSDKSQSLTTKELLELDNCLQKLQSFDEGVEEAEFTVSALDGGSFKISVMQNDQNHWDLYCYHSFEQPSLDRAMTKMRKLLKENYFLKKFEWELNLRGEGL